MAFLIGHYQGRKNVGKNQKEVPFFAPGTRSNSLFFCYDARLSSVALGCDKEQDASLENGDLLLQSASGSPAAWLSQNPNLSTVYVPCIQCKRSMHKNMQEKHWFLTELLGFIPFCTPSGWTRKERLKINGLASPHPLPISWFCGAGKKTKLLYYLLTL